MAHASVATDPHRRQRSPGMGGPGAWVRAGSGPPGAGLARGGTRHEPKAARLPGRAPGAPARRPRARTPSPAFPPLTRGGFYKVLIMYMFLPRFPELLSPLASGG